MIARLSIIPKTEISKFIEDLFLKCYTYKTYVFRRWHEHTEYLMMALFYAEIYIVIWRRSSSIERKGSGAVYNPYIIYLPYFIKKSKVYREYPLDLEDDCDRYVLL